MGRNQKAETGGIIAAVLSLFATYAILMGIDQFTNVQHADVNIRFLVWSAVIACCAVVSFIIGYARLSNSWTSRFGLWIPIRKFFEVVSLSAMYAPTVLLVAFSTMRVTYTTVGYQTNSLFFHGMVSVIAAVSSYFGFVQGEMLTAKMVVSILPVFVISGVMTAALTTTDLNWWRANFSELGDSTSFAANMFNFTLIMCGICVVIVSYFAVYELIGSHDQYLAWRAKVGLPTTIEPGYYTRKRKHIWAVVKSAMQTNYAPEESLQASMQADNLDPELRALRAQIITDKSALYPYFRLRCYVLLALLVITGLMLSGVGVFRYTPHPDMHNFFARGMMVPIYTLLVALPILAPQLNRIVYAVSWAEVLFVMLSGFSWLNGETTLTNVEAITWLLFMAWFIIFSRQIASIAADREYAQSRYSLLSDQVNSLPSETASRVSPEA